MAITSIEQLKAWFKREVKPKQEWFWAIFASFWHKSEKIPVESVEGAANLSDLAVVTQQIVDATEELLSHEDNTSNPHNTTAAQIGAAPLASPVFTGTPTAPTAATGTSSTQIATTAFVKNALNVGWTEVIFDFAGTGWSNSELRGYYKDNGRDISLALYFNNSGLRMPGGEEIRMTNVPDVATREDFAYTLTYIDSHRPANQKMVQGWGIVYYPSIQMGAIDVNGNEVGFICDYYPFSVFMTLVKNF